MSVNDTAAIISLILIFASVGMAILLAGKVDAANRKIEAILSAYDDAHDIESDVPDSPEGLDKYL